MGPSSKIKLWALMAEKGYLNQLPSNPSLRTGDLHSIHEGPQPGPIAIVKTNPVTQTPTPLNSSRMRPLHRDRKDQEKFFFMNVMRDSKI